MPLAALGQSYISHFSLICRSPSSASSAITGLSFRKRVAQDIFNLRIQESAVHSSDPARMRRAPRALILKGYDFLSAIARIEAARYSRTGWVLYPSKSYHQQVGHHGLHGFQDSRSIGPWDLSSDQASSTIPTGSFDDLLRAAIMAPACCVAA